MILRGIRAPWRDDRGGIAVAFAFSFTVFLAAIGIALDYGFAFRTKSRLDAAADAALLTAVKLAADRYRMDDSNWRALGIQAGTVAFTENASNLGSAVRIDGATIDIHRTANEFRGSVTYQATYATNFMRLFQNPEVALANASSVSVAVANYLDVHLLIDASASMGIGASLADQTTLQNATGCALVCHQDGSMPAARATGARLRIDFVRDAVLNFITELKARRTEADQFQISIHLFSNDIHEIQGPTTDLNAAYASAANIDLLDYPAFGSNTTHALSRLNASIPPGGQGYRSNDRRSYVVLLSDGVEDSRYQPNAQAAEIVDPNFVNTSPQYNGGTELLQSMERTACDPLKSNGHTMMTAHIEYLIPPPWTGGAVPRFDFIRDSVTPKALVEYQACASTPNAAYNASESVDIAPMFQRILDDIMSVTSLKLVN